MTFSGKKSKFYFIVFYFSFTSCFQRGPTNSPRHCRYRQGWEIMIQTVVQNRVNQFVALIINAMMTYWHFALSIQ